jgi:hypothetical protein
MQFTEQGFNLIQLGSIDFGPPKIVKPAPLPQPLKPSAWPKYRPPKMPVPMSTVISIQAQNANQF